MITTISYLVTKLPESVVAALLPFQKAVHKVFPFMASQAMIEFTIPSGAAKGKRLLLKYDEVKRYWRGNFEPELLQAFVENISPGMTVYDIGANLGVHSLAFSVLVGERGRVICFEPGPYTIERFKNNIALNSEVNNIELFPYAVSDRLGQIEFAVNELHHAQGQIADSIPLAREGEFYDVVQVPAITLDSFVFDRSQPAPDAIKIDIEGAEHLAVAGMRRVLAEHRPVLFVELHNFNAAQATLEILRQCDYFARNLHSEELTVEALKEIEWDLQTGHIIAAPR